MALDVLIVMGGDHSFHPRAKAALDAYCSNREGDPPFIVTTSGSSKYAPVVPEAKVMHDYLVNAGVPEQDLISEHENFLDMIMNLGADPANYQFSGSCDAYSSLLCALHESEHLGKKGKEKMDYGIVSDNDVIKSHLRLARRVSSDKFTGISSGHNGGLLRKAQVGVQTLALMYDMNRFGVEKDNFHSHHAMLRHHPSFANCFFSQPSGAYATLAKSSGR